MHLIAQTNENCLMINETAVKKLKTIMGSKETIILWTIGFTHSLKCDLGETGDDSHVVRAIAAWPRGCGFESFNHQLLDA